MRLLHIAVLLFAGISSAVAQNLSQHGAFRSHLSDDDFKALQAASAAERGAADLLLRFYEAYDQAAAVAAEYDKVSDVRAADSLHAVFERAATLEKGAAKQLLGTWEQIFDHKAFAYNYLLEVLGEYDVLEQMQHRTTEAVSRIADGRESTESADVLRYFVQKELIFNYEQTIAELLEAPRDSLNEAQRVFELLRKPLPPLSLAERSFITYEAVRVASPARYNAAKPIPAVQVYRQGLVYRVRVGNYPARQAVSAFRGMYPLGYAQSGARWDYFAGAYADLAGAEKGLAEVKKRGFSGAVLAVWNNGAYTLLGAGTFNVEISRGASGSAGSSGAGLGSAGASGSGAGTGLAGTSGASGAFELPPDALAAVKASGRDLTLAGDHFVLGRFDNGLAAERAAAAIRTLLSVEGGGWSVELVSVKD